MSGKQPPLPEQARLPDEQIDEYYERVRLYTVTMATLKTMYRQGNLDLEGYAESEKIIADKYGIPENSIHRSSDPTE